MEDSATLVVFRRFHELECIRVEKPMEAPEALREKARRWRDYARHVDTDAARAFLEEAEALEKEADRLDSELRKPRGDR